MLVLFLTLLPRIWAQKSVHTCWSHMTRNGLMHGSCTFFNVCVTQSHIMYYSDQPVSFEYHYDNTMRYNATMKRFENRPKLQDGEGSAIFTTSAQIASWSPGGSPIGFYHTIHYPLEITVQPVNTRNTSLPVASEPHFFATLLTYDPDHSHLLLDTFLPMFDVAQESGFDALTPLFRNECTTPLCEHNVRIMSNIVLKRNPQYLTQASSPMQCFKSLVVGMGHANFLTTEVVGRGTAVRLFRDTVLETLKIPVHHSKESPYTVLVAAPMPNAAELAEHISKHVLYNGQQVVGSVLRVDEQPLEELIKKVATAHVLLCVPGQYANLGVFMRDHTTLLVAPGAPNQQRAYLSVRKNNAAWPHVRAVPFSTFYTAASVKEDMGTFVKEALDVFVSMSAL